MTTEPAEYDRCGWGTTWGCKEEIVTSDVLLVINAVAEPEDEFDNCHRMFHTACAPAHTVTMTQRRRKITLVRS